jgi:hypothetical protein
MSNDRTPVFQITPGAMLAIFEPSDAAPVTALTEFVPAYPNPGTRDHELVMAVCSNEARFIWCYVLGPQSPPIFVPVGDRGFRMEFHDRTGILFDGERFSDGGRA